MKLFRKPIRAKDLTLVIPAESFCDPREPAFAIGTFVHLNSGGPVMVVVDIEAKRCRCRVA